MLIKGEHSIDAKLTHESETDTIHEAELPAISGKERQDTERMSSFAHPNDLQQWHSVLLKDANGLQTEPALN